MQVCEITAIVADDVVGKTHVKFLPIWTRTWRPQRDWKWNFDIAPQGPRLSLIAAPVSSSFYATYSTNAIRAVNKK